MPATHILQKLEFTRELPTVPVVLTRLLRYMEKPLDQVDVHQIVNLILQDKSLAGHCLQVANSPLFGSSDENEVVTIQASVMAVGVSRIQQIAASCSLLRLMPTISFGLNPAVFWAHSLGCAVVSREFAAQIGYPEPAKAYAAGLLHDIGVIALLWVSPQDFRRCFEEASRNRIPLYEAEHRVFGITHCESGKIIAQNWRLSEDITDVIVGHHSPEIVQSRSVLTSIISVSDLLCRIGGLGYGYSEDRQTDFREETAFTILAAKYPALRPFDLARFTFETEGLIEEVRAVVSQVYGDH